ncbi:MAG TPA: CYTH domain-containing protein [Candidatus Blautia intestinigallinarum]|nr:CYTH domain-containing protein [Candidatus Blautia intestinigallinarum]
MEIERKFLIQKLPDNIQQFPSHRIEQGYLCTNPVVRIRREDDSYILTYKSQGMMSREEYNLPLTKEAYQHLCQKTDGVFIQKTRYIIPEKENLKIELDIFHGSHQGLILAEVEFPDEQTALAYQPPSWFSEDVTFSSQYHNSYLSQHPFSGKNTP